MIGTTPENLAVEFNGKIILKNNFLSNDSAHAVYQSDNVDPENDLKETQSIEVIWNGKQVVNPEDQKAIEEYTHPSLLSSPYTKILFILATLAEIGVCIKKLDLICFYEAVLKDSAIHRTIDRAIEEGKVIIADFKMDAKPFDKLPNLLESPFDYVGNFSNNNEIIIRSFLKLTQQYDAFSHGLHFLETLTTKATSILVDNDNLHDLDFEIEDVLVKEKN
jgi:hypothetical protein